MASNVSQKTLPDFYSSANDDVIYTFEFTPYLLDPVSDAGGYARFNLVLNFDVTPVIGEYVFVKTNLYNGEYKVLASSSAYVTLDTPYIGTITGSVYNCYHLRVPTFSLYKGFKVGESFPTNQPYSLVTSIKPSVLYDTSANIPYLSINLKGITKYLFTISSNTVSGSVDFSMFQVIRVVWDNITTTFSADREYTIVLNSVISNYDFNYRFVGTGVNLLPIDKPLIASSGVTFASIIVSSGNANDPFPRVYKFLNGTLVV